MRMIDVNSLEIFKQNEYFPTDIGMVSNNAYLSIVATNKCQCNCLYCINSETDKSLDLPIDKAYRNIQSLVDKYGVKEAIILGGEPLMHPSIISLIGSLRRIKGLKMLRLTTNGIMLDKHPEMIPDLVHPQYGIQGINISCHNGKDFMSYERLREVTGLIRNTNPDIKIRINSNIWRGNLDNMYDIMSHIDALTGIADEIRISNIIEKDSFSVNQENNPHGSGLILSDETYNSLFYDIIRTYGSNLTVIDNPNTLGFVRYVLIPRDTPIIINWNIGSKVAEQVCENDIKNRKINTFKCLVDGSISLSWNKNNVIIDRPCTY